MIVLVHPPTYLHSVQAKQGSLDSHGANSPYLLDCPSYKEREDKAMDRLIQQQYRLEICLLATARMVEYQQAMTCPWMMVMVLKIDRECLEGIPSRQYQKHYHTSIIQRYTISLFTCKIILHSTLELVDNMFNYN